MNQKTGEMFNGFVSNLRDDLIGTGFSAPDRSVDAVRVELAVLFDVPSKEAFSGV